MGLVAASGQDIALDGDQELAALGGGHFAAGGQLLGELDALVDGQQLDAQQLRLELAAPVGGIGGPGVLRGTPA